jgi:hypothetical protein
VFVECVEKTGLRDFGVFPRHDEPAFREQNELPEEKCNSQDKGWRSGLYWIGIWNSKMEIPIVNFNSQDDGNGVPLYCFRTINCRNERPTLSLSDRIA